MRARKKRGDAAGAGERYRGLASIYDRLVGDTAFEVWRENFERLEERYAVSFRSACDVACGTGLALAYLAARCPSVYGVDISVHMLRRARKRTAGLPVTLLRQGFDELDLPERVDLLTCNFDSLNYLLTEAEVGEAFRRFASSLAPGGYCIFDMNTARELEVRTGRETLVHALDGAVSIWESEWDRDTRINTLEMTNFTRLPGGLYRRSREVHRERSYDTGLLMGLLERAGFAGAEALDARDLTGLGEDARRVQFVARR